MGLVATDFIYLAPDTSTSAPEHPNFSGPSSPIEFGFLRANSTAGVSYTTEVGIDNWSVTVHRLGDE
jgi:hypothetical protein